MKASAKKTKLGYKPQIQIKGLYCSTSISAKVNFVHRWDAIAFAEKEIRESKKYGSITW